jgi:hypothetical protein
MTGAGTLPGPASADSIDAATTTSTARGVTRFSFVVNIPNSPIVSDKLFALTVLANLANKPVSAGQNR